MADAFLDKRHNMLQRQFAHMTLDQYLRRLGMARLALGDHVRASGLLDGNALFFRFVANIRGAGNMTVYEPIFVEGRVVWIFGMITSFVRFPDNDEVTLELVDYVSRDKPEHTKELIRGTRIDAMQPVMV
ncbi:hypothetical protein [Salipiger mucosus]|uniref:Uncharacterized protein n=1 Tax=Salipiger mucosus DSM 16094 TaxID=1123237 RepID=S9S565_9RHOB|nr:hypothetical protein [Salipiger mucosus]EPX85330.1 hypothetical protein Salmuc_02709 [Salipiger mucosus DSM 16094]